MQRKVLPHPDRWIIAGIPVLFMAGSLLHFVYALSGKSPVAGAVAAVNESVWEHCKMVLLPVILWWSLYYSFKGKQYAIERHRWFTGAIAALLVALCSIPLLFYFYTQAFGVELLWVDILLLLVALALGQFTGLHVYRYGKGVNTILVFALLAAIVLAFVLFTFFPPHLPLFRDSVTGNYGLCLLGLYAAMRHCLGGI